MKTATLRKLQCEPSAANVSTFQRCIHILKSVVNDLISVSATSNSKCLSNSMCKYYGHIINHRNWKTGLPRCQDCGIEISSPSMLRKAQPISNEKKKK